MSMHKKCEGFTIIEILIAMVVLIIGSLGIATLTVSIIRGNTFNSKITTATLLSRNRLQDAQRLGYANVDTIAVTENYNIILNYSAYKRITSIAPNSPAPNMKTVTVTVYWDSDRKSVSVSTILSE